MDDVRQWLDGLGLSQYADAFEANAIDRALLPDLTDRFLKDLGVSVVGHRMRILRAVEGLRAAQEAADERAAPPTEQPAPARAAPEAERRQLTVMFCDLVGSTALSEKLDPEELRTLIQAYREACGEVIARYDGHLAQYLGDGVMVYFGWPRAHEDDAQRAVRAGLDIVAAVGALRAGERLRVRVGIATGLVVVGESDTGEVTDAELAVGETPNLAARIQALAEPGSVAIGQGTRRLLGGAFELADLGAHRLKGVSGRVQVHKVLGAAKAASRFEAAHDAGLTPLVGRESEVAMLLERWDQAKDGEGQVVLLSGEAGIGKSRITQVLREQLSDEPHTRLRYQCSPYYTNSAFYPIIAQFERAAAAGAVREAIALCDQAIEALGRSGRDDIALKKRELYQKQKKAGFYLLVSDFDGAHAENERAAAVARRLGDPIGEGSAVAGMAFASLYAHKFERSLGEASRALEIGRAAGSEEIMAGARDSTGWVQAVTGHLGDARRNLEQAHALSRSAGAAFHQSMSGAFLSLLDNWQGDYAASVVKAEGAAEIARNKSLQFPSVLALFCLGLPLTAKGDYDKGLAVFSEGLALAGKLGEEILRNRLLNSMGWLHAECGNLERAIELNEKGVGASRERGDPETIVNCELNLADAYLIKGERALARDYFQAEHGLVRKPSTSDWMKWRYSQHLFAGLGEVWLALDDPTKAEDFCNQCLELATRTDSKRYLARGWRLKAEIAMARRKWEDAEQSLRLALTFAERTGNPTQLWKTRLACGRLYRETGRSDLMGSAYRAARQVLDGVGQGLRTAALKDGFDRSPVIRGAYEQSEVG